MIFSRFAVPYTHRERAFFFFFFVSFVIFCSKSSTAFYCLRPVYYCNDIAVYIGTRFAKEIFNINILVMTIIGAG